MATGQEEEDTTSQNVAGNRKREVKEETDRYQEGKDVCTEDGFMEYVRSQVKTWTVIARAASFWCSSVTSSEI